MQKPLGSALPSGIGSRSAWDTISNTGTNPRTEHDGVWIPEETFSSRLRKSDIKSDISDNTHGPASTINTKNSIGTWADVPIEQTRQRRQASTTNNTNTGFAKQGAYREPVQDRVENRWMSDQVKKAEAGANEQDSDSDEADSDASSDFEL